MAFTPFLRFKKYVILLKCLNWFCLAVIWKYFAMLQTLDLLLKILTLKKILLLKVYLAVEKFFERKVNFGFFFSLFQIWKNLLLRTLLQKLSLSYRNRRKCFSILIKSAFLLIIMILADVGLWKLWNREPKLETHHLKGKNIWERNIDRRRFCGVSFHYLQKFLPQ